MTTTSAPPHRPKVACLRSAILRPGPASSTRLESTCVREQAAGLRNHTDTQLTAEAGRLAAIFRAQPAVCSAEQMIEAFALAYEGIRRVVGLELYNEQIISGMLLCRGMIAEMATGEGKTLCAALPAIFYGLRGQSVHVATPNAYLAERDCELLTPVYRLLSCSVGLLRENGSEDEKRAVYACDIVYGTGYEFGFDYLREQLAGIAQSRSTLGSHYRDVLRGGGGVGTRIPRATRRRDHRRNRFGHDRRSLHPPDYQRKRLARRKKTPASMPRR